MTTTQELLKEFGPSIWTVDGPTVNFYGFPYPTRMVIVQLDADADGGCWVWSPIALTDELANEIQTKVGPVKHVVSPNKIHHLYLKQWQDKYPDASFYAPPGLKDRKVVENVRFDYNQLDFTCTTEDDNEMTTESNNNSSKPPYAADISQVIFHGSFAMEEVVFYHLKSRTAIFGDLIQRFPEDEMVGWKGWLMKMDSLVGKSGSTPREWRFTFMFGGKTKARAARDVVVKEWKPEKLVIAHGECVAGPDDGSATDVIAHALSWM